MIRAQEPRILNLDPPPHLKGDLQRENLDFLARLNRRHLERHPGEADLEARIASYELAARMQSAAKDALDISQETRAHAGDVRPRPARDARIRHAAA